MENYHRKALDEALQDLALDLDTDLVLTSLIAKGIFSEEDEAELKSIHQQEARVRKFVSILKTRGPQAFHYFTNTLEERGFYQHLSQKLEEAVQHQKETEHAFHNIKEDDWHSRLSAMRIRHTSLKAYKYRKVPTKLHVVILGKTGSGKSSTCNTLLGKNKFVARASFRACTSTVQLGRVVEDGITIDIMDTPGLFDTRKEIQNEHILLEIAKTVMNFPTGVHVFLIVCRCDSRFTFEERNTITEIEKHFGEGIFNNCLLVFTRANELGSTGKLIDMINADDYILDLFGKVSERAIAIDNKFEPSFNQRLRILCAICEVVSANKGSTYSNEIFKFSLDYQTQRRRNLEIVRRIVNDFIRDKVVTATAETLESIKSDPTIDEGLLQKVQKHINDLKLEFIDEEDIISYAESSIHDNMNLVEVLLEKKKNERRMLEERWQKDEENLHSEKPYEMEKEIIDENTQVEQIIDECVTRFIESDEKSPEHVLFLEQNDYTDEALENAVLSRVCNLTFTTESKVRERVRAHMKSDDIQAKLKISVEKHQKHLNTRSSISNKRSLNVMVLSHLRSLTENELREINTNEYLFEKLVSKIKDNLSSDTASFDSNVSDYIKEIIKGNISYYIAMKRRRKVKEQAASFRILKEHIYKYLFQRLVDMDTSTLKKISRLNNLSKTERALLDKSLEQITFRVLPTRSDVDVCIEEFFKEQGPDFYRSIEENRKRYYDKENIEIENQKQRFHEELKLRETINDIVDENVVDFIRGKTFAEMRSMKRDLKGKKIPAVLFSEIEQKLPEKLRTNTDKRFLEHIILDALIQKEKIIREIVKKQIAESDSCFPNNAFVVSLKYGKVHMSSIMVGDKVLSTDRKGGLVYKDVYYVAHNNKLTQVRYIRITTERRKEIHMSPNHCLPIGEYSLLKNASQVQVDDVIFSVVGNFATTDKVVSVTRVQLQGAHCPYTLNGTIVVDDIVTSCYTSKVPAIWTHKILGPLRCVYSKVPLPYYKIIAYKLKEIQSSSKTEIVWLAKVIKIVANANYHE